MTLTIQSKEDENRQLDVTVEIAEERVQKEMRKVAKKLAGDMNIPGFRKGKAPYSVIVKRFGEQSIRGEAIEKLMDPVFQEMLDEVKPEMFAQANMTDVKIEPAVLQFTIPLMPELTLGDYRSLRQEVAAVEVQEEAVIEALEQIRLKHKSEEQIDRPAAAGDLVVLSGTGKINEDDGLVLFKEDSLELLLDADKLVFGEPFINELTGISAGDEKQFTISYPEDFTDGELAGKEILFDLEILDVKEISLPALDDELAKLEEKGDTLEELTVATREELQKQAEANQKSELFDSMVKAMIESAEKLVYPPVAIELQLDDMVARMKQMVEQSGWKIEDYMRLQLGQPSMEALRESWKEEAEQNVRRNIVLQNFVEAEKLTVEQSEVDAKLDAQFGDIENEETRLQIRQMLGAQMGDNLRNEILFEKLTERMIAIYKGEAPDLDAESEDDAAEEAEAVVEEPAVEETAVEETADEEAEAVTEEAAE